MCDGVACEELGEMETCKGWILITEHPPALLPFEIRHNLHCGAPAPQSKMRFPGSCEFQDFLLAG